jgi:hypothetical protein
MLPRGLAEPGIEPRTNGFENGADRPGLELGEVKVFGVSARRRQHDLVERGPAAEGGCLRDVRPLALARGEFIDEWQRRVPAS